LAAQYLNGDKFAGGIIAVANHVAGFCDDVKMFTTLGAANSQEEFVRDNVKDGIKGEYFYQGGDVPTIVKRRFIAAYPFQTLFEIYEMRDDGFTPEETSSFCMNLAKVLPEYDVVIVTDYGHGMLGLEVVELLCEKAKFLAINTQVNAGNRGFNTVSKYRRADFICVSENEIRLEARSRDKDLRTIITEVAERLSCPNIVITQGQHGSLCYNKEEGFFEIPALATTVVDRIGAGDAVFSISALCSALEAPMEVLGLIGNAAGAEAVATIGHKTSIERIGLSRHIEALLK
jgi:bifunctional ADP-heptose synthase (sugar kinase/adenylyltransferase)